jgi:uncharacterized protein (TIGR03067 family)
MKHIRSVVILVALFAFPSPAGSQEPPDEAKQLAGKWRAISGAWRGNSLTEDQARQCVLVFHPPRPVADLSGGPRGLDLSVPDKLVDYQIWTTADKLETRYVTEWQEYRYTLDPSASPCVLNAMKFFGAKGHGFAGIYRLEGDTLTVCFNFNRTDKLPKEFRSPKGSEVLVLTLKRTK